MYPNISKCIYKQSSNYTWSCTLIKYIYKKMVGIYQKNPIAIHDERTYEWSCTLKIVNVT